MPLQMFLKLFTRFARSRFKPFWGAMGIAEMFAWGVPAVLVLLHLHLLFLADLEEEIARAKDFGFGPLFDAPAV